MTSEDGAMEGQAAAATTAARQAEIRRLYGLRPTRPWLRISLLLGAVAVVLAWSRPALWPGHFFDGRRLANLQRFLGELRPYPLQGRDVDLAVAWSWAADLLSTRGWQAATTTLALSVVAIVVAWVGSLPFTFLASRSLATPQPFANDPRPASTTRRWLWRLGVGLSRGVLILLRSLPEYLWAFLLLAILGPSPWGIILALAIHNLGSLGRLNAEVVENLEARVPAALRTLGASRAQITVAGIVPLALPRWLLYVFYRWETCVREATVLGMLGIVSLGYWIVDARARNHYDEMFFYVLLGAALVLLGDLASAVARAFVRRAS